MNGYRDKGASGTGWDLSWDFIVIHESAHEWFGNSLTTADQADMWVHEGVATYAEGLVTGCQYGERAGAEYLLCLRKRVRNDRPVIAPYGVNAEGSGDMY